MSGYPGAAFDQWDAASKRRFNAAQGAPRPSWDVPEGGDWGSAGWSSGSTGDSRLDRLRDTTMQDYSGRIRGARLAAEDSSDPSLAAYAGLNALLSGQGDAARSLTNAGAGYEQMLAGQDFQREMALLQARLAEEYQKKANHGAMWGDLAQLGGTLGGAWLGGL